MKKEHSLHELQSFLKAHHFNLNAQQQEALCRIDGPTLLLAVPGSGKTTVVICRLGYMIETLGISAGKILNLTFSRASARDMAKRYEELFPDTKTSPQFSTIHSFALGVIRSYEKMRSRSAFEVLQDPAIIIRSLYLKLFKGVPGESDLSDILSGITYAKNMLSTPDEIAGMKIADIDFKRLFDAYEDYKKRHRLMDFDDMLIYALGLLKREKDLLSHYTRRFRYIHLDEAQDTSRVQFELVYLLASAKGNLFMVGDEDQSIYGFRGAFPQELMDFKRRFPDGKVLLMETNYRSTGRLVQAADRFIARCEPRYPKHMNTPNSDGVAAEYTTVANAEKQYRKILQLARKGSADTAVLYRNNESVIPLADLFEREGVPYRLKEHHPLFFSHFVVTDFKRIWDFAKDPTDFELFKKIYYKMDSGLSKLIIAGAEWRHKKNTSVFKTIYALPTLEDWQRKKLKALEKALKKCLSLPGNRFIDFVLYDCGYAAHLEYRTQHGFGEGVIDQKLNVLRMIAAREIDGNAFFKRLEVLEKLMQEQNPIAGEKEVILFSTIHSAKGLEFDKVIMIDAVDGEFPSKSALDDTPEGKKLFQEEMRLFYVGVTRAKKALEFIIIGKEKDVFRPVSRFITMYRGRSSCEGRGTRGEGRGQRETTTSIDFSRRAVPSASRMDMRNIGTDKSLQSKKRKALDGIKNLPRFAVAKAGKSKGTQNIKLNLQPGMSIRHRVLGEGKILSVDGTLAVVQFPCGEKKLDMVFCEANHMIE